MFDPTDKQRVLEATDLVRLVQESIALKKKGRDYVGLCPFHDDHSPSMYVVPGKQIYKCFSCGAGGDALSWMTNYAKMSFPEALEHLAERAGIKLTPRRAPVREEGDDTPQASRDEIARANQFACDFFRVILNKHEHGTEARAILERRGISPEMAEKFLLGAAPDKWDGLLQVIEKKGLDVRLFVAAGLIKRRESGNGHYDSFRNRLIFPIADTMGRIIAFGGRKIREEDEPKYLNSPESALFNKSATLYALPLAAPALRKEDQAVVVEGYMDAIACHQAGVTNVVATLGTALTSQGARVLQRQCQKVVLLFDGDEAGQRAADRAIEVLFESTLDVRIATMTTAAALGSPAKDPDELVKQPGGVDLLHRIIAGAADALDYRFLRLRDTAHNLSMQAKAKLIEEEITRLVELGLGRLNPVHRQMVIKRIATLAGVGEEAVRQAIAKARPRDRRGEAQEDAPGQTEVTKPLGPRETALACVLCEFALLEDLTDAQRAHLAPGLFERETVKKIALTVAAAANSGQTLSLQMVLSGLDDEPLKQAAVNLASEVDAMTRSDPKGLKDTLSDCLKRLDGEGTRARALQALQVAVRKPAPTTPS